MPAPALCASHALTPQEAIEDAMVLVEDGRIAAIGGRADVKLPPGAKESDARGPVSS